MSYNPSDVGKKGTIFGLPYAFKESDLIFLPVHLDVTVSYGGGTSQAPDLILGESTQLDLSITNVHDPWSLKMAMVYRLVDKVKNDDIRKKAKQLIECLERGREVKDNELKEINTFCAEQMNKVYEMCKSHLQHGKIVAVVGGDHSSPLGLIKALSQRQSLGILQIDAHMDLREAYEGFVYSHASIMRHSIGLKGVKSLTQVGIRDFCAEEEQYVSTSAKPIHVFYDQDIHARKIRGEGWFIIVQEIIETLPDKVYISFDMDGLDPSLSPCTGTPVPGGLGFNDVIYLIEEIVNSGKTIIGFDVCETGAASWDANVGARILYRLAVLTGISNKLLSFR